MLLLAPTHIALHCYIVAALRIVFIQLLVCVSTSTHTHSITAPHYMFVQH
jgi:hypothetical protein